MFLSPKRARRRRAQATLSMHKCARRSAISSAAARRPSLICVATRRRSPDRAALWRRRASHRRATRSTPPSRRCSKAGLPVATRGQRVRATIARTFVQQLFSHTMPCNAVLLLCRYSRLPRRSSSASRNAPAGAGAAGTAVPVRFGGGE